MNETKERLKMMKHSIKHWRIIWSVGVLEVDRLTKSLTLIGSGVVLLAARSFLNRSTWARKKIG